MILCTDINFLKHHPLVFLLFSLGADGTKLAPEIVGYSAPRDLHRLAAYSIFDSGF